MSTYRIALGIEYNGSAYAGWQRQKHSPSVQQNVESALSFVADEAVSVHCAGRTDTGVHALSQVVHFETNSERDDRAWMLGANCRLPDDIRIHWVKEVDAEFHARFSATSRRYRYIVYNHPVASGLFTDRSSWYRWALNEQLMHQAAQALLGEQDFTTFRSVGCQSRSTFRNVHSVKVSRLGEQVFIDIQANAFLYHMVRNIVGSLLLVGNGKQAPEWIGELLTSKDRNLAGATAPAQGLYFVNAEYPEEYAMPTPTHLPVLFS